MKNQQEDWVVLAETHMPEEAMAWRDLLQGTGIEVNLCPELNHFEPYPGTVATDKYVLSVPKEQEDLALTQLKEIQNSTYNDALELHPF